MFVVVCYFNILICTMLTFSLGWYLLFFGDIRALQWLKQIE